MLFSTISTPTSRRTTAGSSVISTCTSTSRQHAPPGSTRSRFGSPSWQTSRSPVSFNSVVQLRSHIDAFVENYNEHAKPFAWTKSEVHQKRLKARFADQ